MISEILEGINKYADLLNLIIIGILTGLTLQANRASVNAAKSANDLSKQIYEQQQEESKRVAEIKKRQIIEQMNKVIELLNVHSNGFFNGNKMKTSPLDLGLSTTELASYFSVEEANLILDFWDKYGRYIDSNWINAQGEWRESGFDSQESSKLANESFALHDELLSIRDKLRE